MSELSTTHDTTDIWVLLDERAGNRSQCLGVAEALGMPYEIHEITYNTMASLPNALKGASFMGLSPQSKAGLCAPWPRLVIAAGRRTANAARAIKRRSGGKTALVQIMYPGDYGLSDFDLVAVPSHDRTRVGGNILSVDGAPHGVTAEKLNAAAQAWRGKLAHLPTPRIALMVGGSTRRRQFSPEMGRELGRAANAMAKNAGGSLMISTSRRTGAAGKALMGEITVPHVAYHWGDVGDNPFFGYLALANGVIVSGDSVSMCSEACASGSSVYIYAPPGFATEKHMRLHNVLFENGYAQPLSDTFQEASHPQLNAAHTIAAAIRERIGFDI